MEDDKRHIELLAIFHYAVGAITALMSCVPIIHLVLGIMLVSGTLGDNGRGHGPPQAFGWLFIAIASVFILSGWTLSICIVVAGRRLAKFNHWTFCLVVAAFECMLMPFGTVLGVFTIILLTKPSVKKRFDPTMAAATLSDASE
ncbi:MAG: hypothetical protein GXP55_23115 [Deltaproteobacteria bacterium]|nr:hypothetical protein [Deltaproteobacteria bacterium]